MPQNLLNWSQLTCNIIRNQSIYDNAMVLNNLFHPQQSKIILKNTSYFQVPSGVAVKHRHNEVQSLHFLIVVHTHWYVYHGINHPHDLCHSCFSLGGEYTVTTCVMRSVSERKLLAHFMRGHCWEDERYLSQELRNYT